MFTVSIDPIIFSIGHLMIRWYSLIAVAVVVLGAWIAAKEAKRLGLGEDLVVDGVMWAVIPGLLGARLFHVIDHWPDEFAANPMRVFSIWEGGLAIWGGVLGGLAGLAIFARRRKLPLSLLADVAVPGLVLAQGVGRIACVITGDAMGKATTGPFGFAYTSPNAMVPQLGVYYTPTPIYEMIMNVSIFAILWRLRVKKLPQGALSLIYFVLYSTGRFFVAFSSSYKTIALGLNQAQLISLGALLVCVPALVALMHSRPLASSPAQR